MIDSGQSAGSRGVLQGCRPVLNSTQLSEPTTKPNETESGWLTTKKAMSLFVSPIFKATVKYAQCITSEKGLSALTFPLTVIAGDRNIRKWFSKV